MKNHNSPSDPLTGRCQSAASVKIRLSDSDFLVRTIAQINFY